MNWSNSQIPQCTCSISHNAPYRTEMCTFLFWMVHCGIWNRCIVGVVGLVHCKDLIGYQVSSSGNGHQATWPIQVMIVLWHWQIIYNHHCWQKDDSQTITEFNLVKDMASINTLRLRQNGHRLADDTFKRIFMNENVRISINISLKFVPTGLINNIPALVQIMAWRRPGNKPLSEPMMVNLLTHICVTLPQWVNSLPLDKMATLL